MTGDAAATTLRPFALALYGEAGVAEACLLLQDRAGVDVNLLLCAAFLGVRRGHLLDPAGVKHLQGEVAPWHREIVGGLRAVRRRLKSGPAPAPDAWTERLREQVKALEIEAELIELDRLGACADRLLAGAPCATGTAEALARAGMAEVVAAAAGRTLAEVEIDALALVARRAVGR